MNDTPKPPQPPPKRRAPSMPSRKICKRVPPPPIPDSAPTPDQVRERRKARISSPPPGRLRPVSPSAPKPKSPSPASGPSTGSGSIGQGPVVRKPPPPPPPPVPDSVPTSKQAREGSKARTSSPLSDRSRPMPPSAPKPKSSPPAPEPRATSKPTGRMRARTSLPPVSEPVSAKARTPSAPTLRSLLLDGEAEITNKRTRHSLRNRHWISLKDITVSNFKAIKKAKIPLGKNVTVLVGPNSCGKSSILQAIHWATRSASNIKPGKQGRTLLFDDIDYMPSSDPVGTFYKGRLGTKSRSNSITVSFRHTSSIVAKVSIRTITGDSGIKAKITGRTAVSPYKQKSHLISAYIPGVAGILEKEKRTVHSDILRKAASGQAGEVLRNILLNLKEDSTISGENSNNLKYLNRYIQEIYSEIDIDVSFDDRSDLHIAANIGIGGRKRRPLDTASTGVLQVIHIFAYMIYFRPKVTLIEEPDSHIHPDKQDRLIRVLERAAKELDTQVVITTHSHHIVRGVSADSKIVWIKNGKPHVDEGDTVRRLLGWGGLDKSVFFFVEDEDHRAMTNILKQWPDIYHKVCICPCYGVGNLPRNGLLKGLLGETKLDIKVVVHRDRDFMTDDEVEIWKRKFKSDDGSYKNVSTWVTSNSDVEAYFCDPSYLSKLYDVDIDEASSWVKEVMKGFYTTEKRKLYLRKREETILSLREEYDDEKSKKLWREHGPALNTITGKDVHNAIKTYLQGKKLNIEELNSFVIPEGTEVATELRDIVKKTID